jgi:D-alanyl-D-alanine carboxypeptidase
MTNAVPSSIQTDLVFCTLSSVYYLDAGITRNSMKHRRLPSLFLILSIASFGLVVQGQTTPAASNQKSANLPRIVERMKARLNAARITAGFPGAEIGFVFVDGETPEGKPKYVSGSIATGVSDLEAKTPLNTSDRLLAGSIGKTFVAALTLLLMQEGKLNLDDKIERWLGTQTWFGQLPNAKDITLRMLLNHSSGIENHVDISSFQKQMFKSASRNIKYEELIGYVLNKKPLFPAGQGYNYADTNYILVGMIIEKATGRTLYELIDERILKPNKLDRTIPANALSLPEVANGYLENKPVIVGGKFTINPQWEWAGGGFASTAEDLARWGNMLYSGEVLSPASLDQMIKSTTTGEGAGYGLGVMISRSKWGRSYGHDGEFPGYLSEVRYYTKYKITIVVMVNSDDTPGVNRFLASAVDDFAEIIIKATTSREVSQADQIKLKNLSEGWLSLIQTKNFDEAWNHLSDRLTARFTKETWAVTMHQFLDRAGELKTRKFSSLTYSDPVAEIVAIRYESSFTKVPTAAETLILEKQSGEWRISSYSIR